MNTFRSFHLSASFYLFLVSTALSSPLTFAELRIATTQSADSRVLVEGNLVSGTRWMLAHVSRVGSTLPQQEHIFAIAPDGIVRQEIFLKQGGGRYTVELFSRTDPQKYGSYSYESSFVVSNLDEADHTGLLPSEWVESTAPEITAQAAQIVAQIADQPGATDAQKMRNRSRALYGWVVNHVVYDDAELEESHRQGRPAKQLTALETFRSRKAVCSGFAHLNAALHRAVGIPALIVHGFANPYGVTPAEDQDIQAKMASGHPNSAINHAWNIVKIAGRELMEDATWGESGREETKYFDLSAEEAKRTHRRLVDRYDYKVESPIDAN